MRTAIRPTTLAVVIVAAMAAAGCCGAEFDVAGSGHATMAGAAPTAQEQLQACTAAKADMDTRATCPNGNDKAAYTKPKQVSVGTCTYSPDADHQRVTANVGGRYKCCDK